MLSKGDNVIVSRPGIHKGCTGTVTRRLHHWGREYVKVDLEGHEIDMCYRDNELSLLE